MQIKLTGQLTAPIPANAQGPFTLALPGGKKLVLQTREEVESLHVEIEERATEISLSVMYEMT